MHRPISSFPCSRFSILLDLHDLDPTKKRKYNKTVLYADNQVLIAKSEYKLQTYNRINGIIKRHFGKQMSNQTKLRIHNIIAKTALKYGSETWMLNKRGKQRLEATTMRFVRPLLGYTKLDRQRNVEIRERLRVQSIVEEIQTNRRK
jgi:hypothetical protein